MAHLRALALASLMLLPGLDAQDSVTFEHVNVVPMDREVILRDHTVVVRSARIANLGPAAEVQVPRNTTRIDGRGLYMMPGLADMHVHLTDRADLTLYVAHGVTTVRNMWGGPDTLELRERIRTGEVFGPRIFTTGPIMDGENPTWRGSPILTSTEAATRAVEEQKEAGYDAFKVYDGVSVDVYSAVLSRAWELDFPVVGHVPTDVGLRYALFSGQRSVEHLNSYPDDLSLVLLSAHGATWNCPTLVVYDLPFAALRDLQRTRRLPEMRLVPPRVRARWDPATDERFGGMTEMTDELFATHQNRMEKLYRTVRNLHGAGIPMLLGTDAPNPFVVPGFSAHQELEQLVSAGLSPFEALQTGTTGPAMFLSRDDSGTVGVGKTADLLLLGGNPLDDITNTRNLAGVMLRGRWLPKTDLDGRLRELVASYRAPEDWFSGMPDGLEDSTLQYEVYWNTTQIGADRFELSTTADGGTLLRGQSVLTDQLDEKRISSRLSMDRNRRQLEITVWSGDRRGNVSAVGEDETLVLHGSLPSGEQVDLREPTPDDAYVGTGILPHSLLFAPRLLALPVGGRLQLELRTPEFEEVFEISTTRVDVTRTEDTLEEIAGRHIRVRSFSVRLTTGQYSTPATLTIDEEGMPVVLTLVFQQGHKIFRRAE